MRKKGIVLLLVLGVLLLVGCENEVTRIPPEVCKTATEWGEGTSEAPYISFLLDGDESTLETMDIFKKVGDSFEGYYVTVLSTKGNTIKGTYHTDDENPKYDIILTLSYSPPELTVKITGKGPLAGQKFVVEPRLD